MNKWLLAVAVVCLLFGELTGAGIFVLLALMFK